MRRKLFEDDSTANGQSSGPGTAVVDGSTGRMDTYMQNDKDAPAHIENKLYPLDAIETTIADIFVNVSNVQKLLDVANQNPAFDEYNEHLETLASYISDIAGKLVDFDEVVTIIKS